MKKIPSLFVRDYEKKIIDYKTITVSLTTQGEVVEGGKDPIYTKGRFLATDQITPGCEWVLNGEGVATRKWDGTAVLFMDGKWFKRYDAKAGKTPPPDFFEAQPEPDPITGHWPGWVSVVDDYNGDRYIVEAISHYLTFSDLPDEPTTFEAVGPKINGNRDRHDTHTLYQHGTTFLASKIDFSREGLIYFFEKVFPGIEGIVFHHPDGRMCKVKRSDFGLPW
jgi:hypothetical protein